MIYATVPIAAVDVVPKDLVIVPMASGMVPAVSKMHCESFVGYTNVRLGVSYITRFITWFIESSRTIALVALEDDTPVGYVFGAPTGYGRQLNRDLLLPAMLAVLGRPGVCISRNFWQIVAARAATMIHTTASSQNNLALPPPTMSLVAVGVSPHARGRSVGGLLLEHFEAKARALGMRSLQLSVYADNGPARRLYEKYGWQCFSNNSPQSAKTLRYFRLLG